MTSKHHTARLTRARKLALASALAAMSATITGCATGSSSSWNPLAKKADGVVTPTQDATPGITSSISRFAEGTRNQASSMGMAVKSAYSKGRDSVAGVFGGKASATNLETGEAIAKDDPLLLNSDKPTSVGPEVFVANGQLWESTGNYDRAMDNYSKALEKEPSNSPALASIARLHYRQQQYDKAVAFFQKAIQASPQEAGLYNDLGLTLSQIGRHEEAVAAMAKAIELAPATSRYANNLATVQFQAGREDDARATLLKHNTPAVAHYNMAYLQYSAQKNDKALQELGQVLAMSETAGTDSASQRAVTKSKELFEKLGGPATQIAQSLPHLYGNVQQSGQAVAQLASNATQVFNQVRTTAGGVTAQFSDDTAQAGVVPTSSQQANPATPPQSVANAPTPQPSTPVTAETNPNLPVTSNQFVMPTGTTPTATTTNTNTGGFVMPDMFNSSTPAVAEQPTGPQLKR